MNLASQQDHPLAPNRPLAPITWKQAPAEPHGYYDRLNYSRGWNDAVSVAQKLLGEVGASIKELSAELPRGDIIFQVWENAQPSYWRDTDYEEYSITEETNRRSLALITR